MTTDGFRLTLPHVHRPGGDVCQLPGCIGIDGVGGSQAESTVEDMIEGARQDGEQEGREEAYQEIREAALHPAECECDACELIEDVILNKERRGEVGEET